MKSFNEIMKWFAENGYHIEKSNGGYYYCMHKEADGTEKVAWMDSACEDAYEFETATSMAYVVVSEIKPHVGQNLSPMVKQFLDLKKKHPDALLLFRCGDFYETYLQDAEDAAKILGITLTNSSKTKGPDGKPLTLAGFPYHQLDTYLPKLIRAGQRVAICDQIESK